MPTAANCWVIPALMVGIAGETAIDVSVGGAVVTVRAAVPEMAPDVAVIVVPPAASVEARPVVLIVATEVADELHVTEELMFCVLLSEYVPVAVNCCVPPAVTDTVAGVTAMDVNVAAVTVRVVFPLTVPEDAVMVVVPADTPEARPDVLMVATEVAEELHVTDDVRLFVPPSVYVPVAVNCCVRPLMIEGAAGVTAMEASVAAVTVRVDVPLMDPDVAVIVVPPAAALVAKPPGLMVATLVADDVHVTDEVMSFVDASVYVPRAVNCCVNPSAMEGALGLTWIAVKAAAVTVSVAEPDTPLVVAVMVVLPTAALVARPAALMVATPVDDEDHVADEVMSAVEPSL